MQIENRLVKFLACIATLSMVGCGDSDKAGLVHGVKEIRVVIF